MARPRPRGALTSLALAMVLLAAPPPPFVPGEELVYELTALGVLAGSARVALGAATPVNGVQALPIVIQSRSEGIFEGFFPVRDRFVSFWDPVSGLSVESQLWASEKGKRHTLFIEFDRAAALDGGGRGAVARVRRGEGEVLSNSVEAIDPRAEDLASAVFWLRARPLRPGDREEVPIFTGKKQWTLGATVIGREKVTTRAGSFDTVHVRLATFFSGKLASRRDLDGYFTDDPRHIPVRLDAELLLGRFRADLVKVDPR